MATLQPAGAHRSQFLRSTRKATLNSLLGLRRLLALHNQLAQSCNVGSSGGDERIGVGGTPSNGAALLLEPHGDLGLRVRTLRHGVNLIEIEASVVRQEQLDRVEGCIDRPVADALHGFGLAVDVERQRR